ncbi:MAG: sodium-dependent transporter [Muribaculaceae bacterium]|nr:sodium-dependent transporter [Muribaculaceae bacterium]
MATVGSAVGLGTIWRFPAETQAGGGAAFLIIYVGCVFLLGVPVMLSEFVVGRSTRSDAVGAYRKLSPGSHWGMVGALGVLASYLILIFYMVVAGWTLEYLIQSITGELYEPTAASAAVEGNAALDLQFSLRMQEYIQTDWNPLLNTFLVIAINIAILIAGVKKGIERMSNIAMPLLFVLLLIFVGVCVTLPGAAEGVEYFLKPDFSKLTPDVFISALGQALFSLSLGMGILITYSGYYPQNTKLTRTSIVVSSMTLVVALMMGLIIFPAVFSFGLQDHGLAGTALVFVTLPEVVVRMTGGQLWSILFFTLLFVAALTSTVSIAEPSIAFVQKRFNFSRVKSTLIILLPLFVLSAVCSLSFASLSNFKIAGMVIFYFLDTLTNNFMLPLVALGGCIYVGWFSPRNLLHDQLTNNGSFRSRLTPLVTFILRYIAPIAIILILLSNF